MAWALKQQDITDATTRHVLLCLANYAGEGGANAFPSIGQLCKDTGLSESTIRRHLQLLEESGVIAKGNQAIAQATIRRTGYVPTVYDIRGVTVKPLSKGGVSNEAGRGVKNEVEGCQAMTPDPKRSEENLKRAPELLGRLGAPRNFEEEFRARFGVTPDEAHQIREAAKPKPS